MNAPLRIGILGTGYIPSGAVIEPAKQVPEAIVAAVGSRSPERAKSYASAHGIPRALSYEDVVSDPDIDVVYIALPPSLHAEWSILALHAGKHVLCEKPMTANEAEARHVAQIANRSRQVYMEAFHYLYHPFAKRVRDILDAHVIGNIQSVEAHLVVPNKYITADNIRRKYQLGGGAMLDAGCYPLHVLRDVLGEPTQVLSAQAEMDQFDDQADVSMRVELEFAEGRRGTLLGGFSDSETPDTDIVITGDRGSLRITQMYVPQWGGQLRLEWDGRTYTEHADPTASYVYQLREFVRCVRDGAPVLSSADEGVRIAGNIDAIYKKAGLRLRGEV
jgi:predicted dehydrogenase